MEIQKDIGELYKREDEEVCPCYLIRVEGIKRTYAGVFDGEVLNVGDFVEVIFKDKRILPAQIAKVMYYKKSFIPKANDEGYAYQIIKKLFLKRVLYSNCELLMSIDGKVLHRCKPLGELKEIEIPKGVTEIKEEAFWKIDTLSHVKLNDELKVIEKKAFSHTDIYEVKIPKLVEVIGEYAFSYGYNHTKVEVAKENKHFRDDGMCLYKINADKTEELLWCFGTNKEWSYILPKQVIRIKKWAFAECYIKNIVLNEGLKYIEDRAFTGTFIKEIDIPSTVEEIGDIAKINRIKEDISPFSLSGEFCKLKINLHPNGRLKWNDDGEIEKIK